MIAYVRSQAVAKLKNLNRFEDGDRLQRAGVLDLVVGALVRPGQLYALDAQRTAQIVDGPLENGGLVVLLFLSNDDSFCSLKIGRRLTENGITFFMYFFSESILPSACDSFLLDLSLISTSFFSSS